MPDCYNKAEHLHHIFPNTKVNQRLYPLFLNSPFNLLPLCSICHENKPLPPKPGEWLISLYEDWLQSIVNDT